MNYGNKGIAVESELEYIKPVYSFDEDDYVAKKYSNTVNKLREINEKIKEIPKGKDDFTLFVESLAKKYDESYN